MTSPSAAENWPTYSFGRLRVAEDNAARLAILEEWKEQRNEYEWLDFKESPGLEDIARANKRLAESDVKNIAKVGSAFANAAGGLLVLGIEERRGAGSGEPNTFRSKPIQHLALYDQKVMEVVSRVTQPPLAGVDSPKVLCEGEEDAGFVVLLFPQGQGSPHQVWASAEKLAKGVYYRRHGFESLPMDHWELEDRFGRRPRPKLALEARVECRHKEIMDIEVPGEAKFRVDLFVRNEGLAIASRLHGALNVPASTSGKMNEFDGRRVYWGLKNSEPNAVISANGIGWKLNNNSVKEGRLHIRGRFDEQLWVAPKMSEHLWHWVFELRIQGSVVLGDYFGFLAHLPELTVEAEIGADGLPLTPFSATITAEMIVEAARVAANRR